MYTTGITFIAMELPVQNARDLHLPFAACCIHQSRLNLPAALSLPACLPEPRRNQDPRLCLFFSSFFFGLRVVSELV